MKRQRNAAIRRIGAALAATACLMTTQAAHADPQTCSDVKMAAPGWTDIDATNAMAGVVLKRSAIGRTWRTCRCRSRTRNQERAGRRVPRQLDARAGAREAVRRRKSIDVLHANLSGAKFTLAVPDYVAAAGVHRSPISGATRTASAARSTGSAGAPANQNIKRMLSDHALGAANWSLVESSETGMLTQVERAVRDKRWIVFLAWEPHLMNTKFHLTYLSGGDAYFGPNYGGATVNRSRAPGSPASARTSPDCSGR